MPHNDLTRHTKLGERGLLERIGIDARVAGEMELHVHQRGVGVCGIFPYEVAETKVSQVIDYARQNQHPLQCTLEKA